MLIASAKFTGVAVFSSHVEDPVIPLFVLCEKFILSFSSAGLGTLKDNSSLLRKGFGRYISNAKVVAFYDV